LSHRRGCIGRSGSSTIDQFMYNVMVLSPNSAWFPPPCPGTESTSNVWYALTSTFRGNDLARSRAERVGSSRRARI
jgi:hypothetical protein